MTTLFRRTAVAAFAAALASAGAMSAAARPAAGPMAAIRAFTEATNRNDPAAAQAAFVSGEASIIDEFRPNVWIGPSALKDWAGAFAADAKAKGQTDQSLTLGAPIRVQAEGDKAYVVTHVVFSYTEMGVKMQEEAVWTFVLDRTDRGWLIKAWAWGGHKPKPVVGAPPPPKVG